MTEKGEEGVLRVVKGEVSGDTVRLTGESGLPHGLTFRVTGRDALCWEFKGVPAGDRASVRFVGFTPNPDVPAGGAQQLFLQLHKDSLPAVAGRPTKVQDDVRDDSAEGTYFYKVFLVHPTGPDTELRCVGPGWGGVEWGGGEKSGKPKGVAD